MKMRDHASMRTPTSCLSSYCQSTITSKPPEARKATASIALAMPLCPECLPNIAQWHGAPLTHRVFRP